MGTEESAQHLHGFRIVRWTQRSADHPSLINCRVPRRVPEVIEQHSSERGGARLPVLNAERGIHAMRLSPLRLEKGAWTRLCDG